MPSSPLEIPWPVEARPGQQIGEGQGDLINSYATQEGDILRIKRMPGLLRRWTYGEENKIARGLHAIPSRLIQVWGGAVTSQYVDGTEQPIAGALAGNDRVTIASNMREDPLPQVVIVANAGAYLVDLDANTVSAYPDADLGTVLGVEYCGGYFFFPKANGDIVASDLQSTDIDPLSVAKAEYAADGLLRCKAASQMLFAFGETTTEVWVDNASSPFPFVRQSVMDVGLLGKWAVAGGSNEWEHGLLWAANDFSVRMLSGLSPKRISNDDVASDIQRASKAGHAAEVIAKVYTFGQEAMFSLTCQPMGWTWEYNVVSGMWCRRDSYGIGFWRPFNALRWRGDWITQDTRESGYLFNIEDGYFWEDTDRQRMRVESGPLKQFPANIRIPSLEVDCTVGLGRVGVPSPYETDPVAMGSWSHDGGAHWARPVARSLGKVGRFATKVGWHNLGRSTHHGFRMRLDITDPVAFVLNSAISTRGRASRPRQAGV